MEEAHARTQLASVQNDDDNTEASSIADADLVSPGRDLAVKSQQGSFLIHKGQRITFHELAKRVPRDEEHRNQQQDRNTRQVAADKA